jgi:ParB/RepB/Spo0J family partition protein
MTSAAMAGDAISVVVAREAEAVVELELHRLAMRYERLRKRHPSQERTLVGSLAELGQQCPVVVVGAEVADGYVLIDGYKRVRALKRLARDTVLITCWAMSELEALLLERSLRCASEDAFDQAWLLAELAGRFGLSIEELAARFARSKSWVSRRLALIQTLPPAVQEQVRCGQLAAHAAMKYLVPLARANAETAAKFASAIAPLKLTSREVGSLYQGWQGGTARTRELILEKPQLYLQAEGATRPPTPSPTQRWLDDLTALAAIARRARRALETGLWARLLGSEREELECAFARMRADFERLIQRFELEGADAG